MEKILAGIVVGIIEAIIFGVFWKKKVGPLRVAAKMMVTAVKDQAATAVADQVKKVTAGNPAAKAVLDVIIKEAHANILDPNDK